MGKKKKMLSFKQKKIKKIYIDYKNYKSFCLHNICVYLYNPKSEKVGTVWKTRIKKESSDF